MKMFLYYDFSSFCLHTWGKFPVESLNINSMINTVYISWNVLPNHVLKFSPVCTVTRGWLCLFQPTFNRIEYWKNFKFAVLIKWYIVMCLYFEFLS